MGNGALPSRRPEHLTDCLTRLRQPRRVPRMSLTSMIHGPTTIAPNSLTGACIRSPHHLQPTCKYDDGDSEDLSEAHLIPLLIHPGAEGMPKLIEAGQREADGTQRYDPEWKTPHPEDLSVGEKGITLQGVNPRRVLEGSYQPLDPDSSHKAVTLPTDEELAMLQLDDPWCS